MTIIRAAMMCLLCSACDRPPDEGLPVERLVVESPCLVGNGCRLTAPEFTAKITMGPEIQVLRPFPVHLEIASDAAIEQITLSASMQGMDMGVNRYQLQSRDGRTWSANVTLPVCVSGRTDWLALVEIVSEGKRLQFQVSFSAGK